MATINRLGYRDDLIRSLSMHHLMRRLPCGQSRSHPVQFIQIARKLSQGCERQIPAALDGVKVNHCVYCGLKRFDTCQALLPESGAGCGVRKNAFFPHCPACGQRAQGAGASA